MRLSPSLSHTYKPELVSPLHSPQRTHSPVPYLSCFSPKRIRTLTASASVLKRRFTSFSTSGDSIYWNRDGKENRDTVKHFVYAAGAGQLQSSNSRQSPISSFSSPMLFAQPLLMLIPEVIYTPPESNPSSLYRAPWGVVCSHSSTYTT